MPDKRSETSRKNLGKHIKEPLGPTGSTVISLRIPNELLPQIDTQRGTQTRSNYLRQLLQQHLP